MNIKKVYIVNPISQYGVLNYFCEQIAAGFRVYGIDTEFLSSFKLDKDGHLIGITDSDMIFTFNSACGGVFLETVNKDGIPYWAFMVDHPYYHYSRLENWNENQIISVIDRKHLEYLETYYPNIKHKLFVPHGGMFVQEKEIPFEQKKYPITFFGTYRDPDACMEVLKKYNEPMQKLFSQIMDEVWSDREKTLEESVLHNFNRYKLLEKQESLVDIMPDLCALDESLRYRRRALLIQTALKSGFEVHVFGNGWNEYNGYSGNNLIIHENVSCEESLKIIADSKIVLNNMPLFTDGSHERIFSVLASGSICLTDANPYLKECFIDKEDLFYFDWEDIEAVPKLIREILTGQFDVEGIIKSGKKKALEKHLWKNRAKSILEYCQGLQLAEGEKNKNHSVNKQKIKDILDMMHTVLIFIVDNMNQISREELWKMFNDIMETFFCVNEELFNSRELNQFKIDQIRNQEGYYASNDEVINFYAQWHAFISDIIDN